MSQGLRYSQYEKSLNFINMAGLETLGVAEGEIPVTPCPLTGSADVGILSIMHRGHHGDWVGGGYHPE